MTKPIPASKSAWYSQCFLWAWTELFLVYTATGQVVQSGVKKGNKDKIEWQFVIKGVNER